MIITGRGKKNEDEDPNTVDEEGTWRAPSDLRGGWLTRERGGWATTISSLSVRGCGLEGIDGSVGHFPFRPD